MHKFVNKSENSIVVKNVATYVQKSMEKMNNVFLYMTAKYNLENY